MAKVGLNELYAPEQYWRLGREAIKEITNGCGPGGWLRALVPDTIWGLDISEACDIHDYMYAVGLTNEDKEVADRVFLNNIVRLINAKTRYWVLKRLRYRRASTYYLAVKNFGGPFFWSGKNPVETLRPSLVMP